MAKIIQYRPDFVTGFENEVVEFNSLEELLKIPFVNNFSFSPKSVLFERRFHQFSYDDYSRSNPNKRYVILAEYEDSRLWYVVGFTDDNEIVKELPRWSRAEM